jgi:hypothetical protein
VALKEQLLAEIAGDPISLRDLLTAPDVSGALNAIGVLPKVLELHAPSERSRKLDGVGETLCGIRGTRHASVTCKHCKRRAGVGVAR